MKKVLPIVSLAVATLFFASCKKDAAGPAAVDFQLQATNTVAGVNRSEAATIQWTSGTAFPASVKFEAKQNTTEIEYTSNAGNQINLFNIAQSSFGNITLPQGTYAEVELKINLNGSVASPALQLNGTYNNGTTNVPVTFLVTTPLLIQTESNGVNVAGGSLSAVTSLNLAAYTSGITLSMMNSASLSNGSIMISAASNTNLYNIIVTNINRTHHTDINHR